MKNIRLIARLDVKAPNLVKGVQFEGLRKIGDPNEFALRYYSQGVDEIIYIDIVASLYERNSLLEIISKTTADVFVPITVGGGLRSIKDVGLALRAGADKVAINTAVLKNHNLITQVARKFGSQCMVLSIQAKKNGSNTWEAYYDNGRERSGVDVVRWAKKGAELGAGEILLTSVDQEGTGKGFDIDLIKEVSDAVGIPVIAGGGMGCYEDLKTLLDEDKADAVAMAHVLHYGHLTIAEIRSMALVQGYRMRKYPEVVH